MTNDEAQSLLAAATDLLNSWARERSIREACCEKEILKLINRLWDYDSAILFNTKKAN